MSNYLKWPIFRQATCVLALVATTVSAGAKPATQPQPLPVRVVVVTAFELGADTGDEAGEFQAWAERIPGKMEFSAGERDLRYDPRKQVLVISTGMGTNRAATSVMALGHDPRFDLRKAYWLVAAIGGVNPHAGSIGSAAWIGNVVDSDFSYAVDPREAPADWTTGQFPFERTRPYEEPRPKDSSYNLFPLNLGLRDWAFDLTKAIRLEDRPVLRSIRASYSAFPLAAAPPSILKGNEISGQIFWHGALLNTHYERWANYWIAPKAGFVMTAMEDSGTLGALQSLGRNQRVDTSRVMILRTGSNYTLPAPESGIDAAASLGAESGSLSALQASLDTAYQVGSVVVDELTAHWAKYEAGVPAAR